MIIVRRDLLPWRGGSDVPSPPNVILIVDHYCYSLFTRGVALVNTKLSPSCLINKLRRSSYRVTRMATRSRNVVKYSQIEIHIHMHQLVRNTRT